MRCCQARRSASDPLCVTIIQPGDGGPPGPVHGGWTAILSYAHSTTLRPDETPPPDNNATYPHDTHHLLALDGADAAAVQIQVRDLERTGTVGRLTLNRVAAPPWTPGGPPPPGWTIRTHSGSEAERRAWQRRIGQAL